MAQNRIYFTKDTEDAIVEFNESDNQTYRSKIYKEKIEKPLDKLVENIINRFKFPYIQEKKINLKSDVTSFLVLNMDKYDQEKGRAFAYFSILTKNYLIMENNEQYKYNKIQQRIDVSENDTGFDIIDEEQERRMNNDIPEFIKMMIEYWDNNLTSIFIKRQEIIIADAILNLFRRSYNIENFNKKSLYVLIREMTGLRTQYITSVINQMKIHNEKLIKEYRTHGYFDTECIDDFFDD